MKTFCWRCPNCGWTTESSNRDTPPDCEVCWDAFPCGGPRLYMTRDYRAEAPNIDKGAFYGYGMRRKYVSGNVPDPW